MWSAGSLKKKTTKEKWVMVESDIGSLLFWSDKHHQNKCKKYAWMESNRRTSKVSHIKYMKSGHIATLGKQLILPNSVHEAADLVPMEWFLLGGEIAKENKKKVKENDEIQVTNGMKNRSWERLLTMELDRNSLGHRTKK